MTNIRLGTLVVLCATFLFSSAVVSAQGVKPTPEQLQMLQQLPIEQQRALIEKYGKTGTSQMPTNNVEFPPLTDYPANSTVNDVVPQREEPDGIDDELKLFGSDLFDGVPNTFAPATDVPVPPDYVLGPGDTVQVQFYGKENATYNFQITRDGTLNVPELGPVSVVGLSFSEFREDLGKRVKETLIGTNVSVSMGQLRSIRVFVLGDVNRPGSYTVSGLSTMTHALFVSGGITDIGSMRNVQLKRAGKVVATLDLYDLLLQGDTSDDARLMQGDVLFVPTIGKTITVSGAVKRPAIYELRTEKAISDALKIAGGLTASAYPQKAMLERIAADGKRTVLKVDASEKSGRDFVLADGDLLSVPAVLDKVFRQVKLSGHVNRPGDYAWFDGMRLTDLLGSVDELKQQADLQYVLIRRETEPTLGIEVISANLEEALKNPGGPSNVSLLGRDQVFVFTLDPNNQKPDETLADDGGSYDDEFKAVFENAFDKEFDAEFYEALNDDYQAFTDTLDINRRVTVDRLLDELLIQAKVGGYLAEVSIRGQVRAPGKYPLEPGMKVSDLIRAGANLNERAYAVEAELVRFDVVDQDRRQASIVNIDIQSILDGDTSADILLQAYDQLNVKLLPEWGADINVTLEGEFKFPGNYTVRRGETLGSVIDRAGGFSELAFLEGAVFLREELKEREQQAFADAAVRLQSDLAVLAVQSSASGDKGAADSLAIGNSLLNQLKGIKAVGRLVVRFADLYDRDNRSAVRDLEMKDGDRILVPGKAYEVTVIGEVQRVTSHLYDPHFSRDDYLGKSGGLTRKADKKQIYVVRASGDVVGVSSSRWLGRRKNIKILPGDTIVVPLAADKLRPMALWTGVTQILYQGAISVAAVKTFNR